MPLSLTAGTIKGRVLMGRDSSTIQYQILYWRHIPVLVRLKERRTRTSHNLSDRFQAAVYRAAFRSKAIIGDAYTAEWTPTKWQPASGDAATVAQEICQRLEKAYSDQRLDLLARNEGYDPEKGILHEF